jgi:hypothetical protein
MEPSTGMLMLSDGIHSHCVGVYSQILLVEQLLLSSSQVARGLSYHTVLYCVLIADCECVRVVDFDS